ncbi:hypothetical protein [Amniculibacterium sp. G2-70]|uniref:hypothetical protein n=1 Tax=Amniculibacterium sp. G2-70 TaxID=2767188 RepID=UPI0016542D9F|nr:hypothetical protein [Amniculibacterium sp. G2-70]
MDSIDQKPIVYANIQQINTQFGASSDEFGVFSFENDSKVLINAAGYELKTIDLPKQNTIIKLQPKEKLIEEVVLGKRKNKNYIVIDEFRKIKINSYFVCNGELKIIGGIGKYFESKSYPLKFLKSLRILTKSEVSNVKFNIRLFSVDENGDPKDELSHENIIGVAKKGKHKTEVDLSHLNLRMPEHGIFINFEWLRLDENTIERLFVYKDNKKLQKYIMPEIGLINSKIPNTTFYQKSKNSFSKFKYIDAKIKNIAMELTLTD